MQQYLPSWSFTFKILISPTEYSIEWLLWIKLLNLGTRRICDYAVPVPCNHGGGWGYTKRPLPLKGDKSGGSKWPQTPTPQTHIHTLLCPPPFFKQCPKLHFFMSSFTRWSRVFIVQWEIRRRFAWHWLGCLTQFCLNAIEWVQPSSSDYFTLINCKHNVSIPPPLLQQLFWALAIK